MNRQEFIEELRGLRETYEWYLLKRPWEVADGEKMALRCRRRWEENKYEIRGQFCPITAMIHAKTSRYVMSGEYWKYLDLIDMNLQDGLVIACAADGYPVRGEDWIDQMMEAVGVDPAGAKSHLDEESFVERA